ncbi:MAG: hypothetical protein DCC66_10785 [Planctomycetota bacterium]|nr:MAG: hypothetical protein DCC66_10785 [Planctomycetota bacterium]
MNAFLLSVRSHGPSACSSRSLSAVVRARSASATFARALAIVVLTVLPPARAQTGESSDTPAAATMATSAPAGVMTHEKYLAAARKEFTVSTVLRAPDGAPLKLDGRKAVARGEELMTEARAQRKSGDYKTAAATASKAFDTYQKVLGADHYLTTASRVFQRSMDDFARLPPDGQKKMMEADKLAEAAQTASDKGLFADAEKLMERALRSREELLGPKHAEVGESLRQLGAAQLELQLFAKSKSNIERAVAIFEQTYGRNHPKTAIALDRLGWMYIHEGKSEEAIKTLRDAAYILRSTSGDTAEAGEVLDNLGTAFALNGDAKDALNKKLHSLIIRETVLGPKARDTAVSLSNLAWLYTRMNMLDDALRLREEAYATLLETVGPDHTYTKLELGNLARAHETAGNFDRAVALYQEQIARDDQQPEVVDINAMARCTALAAVLFNKGDFDAARKYTAKAVERAKHLLKTTAAPAVVNELYNVANELMRHRLMEEALPVFALQYERDAKDTSALSSAQVRRMETYGQTLIDMGQAAKAVEVMRRAVELSEKVHGKGEPATATALITYSEALCEAGQLSEAERVADAVVKISESRLAFRSAGSAYALLAAGRVYNRQKRLDLAKFTLEDAESIFVESQRDLLGKIECQLELAKCYHAIGDKPRTEATLSAAVETAREMDKVNKTLYGDAFLAKALWHQLELGDLTPSRREAVRTELRKLLERLRDANALNAAERGWLESL